MKIRQWLFGWLLRALDYNPNLYGFWGGGIRSKSGAIVNDQSAMTVSAVFACVSLISRMIATIPLITYRRLYPRGKERAQDYGIYNLLRYRWNSEQTSLEGREMASGHVLLRGNAYIAIERDSFGYPIGLVPLHPDHVSARRTRDGSLIYEWHPTDGQKPRVFRQDQHDLLHLRMMLGKDGITGMSVIEMAREGFGVALALEEYGATLFANGAHFMGALKYSKKLDPKMHEQLRKDYAEKRGVENAFKHPLILEDGMDWISMGMNAHDAEFLASRRFQVAEIARWFHVPLHMLNETEKSTTWGSGLEQQTQGFLTFTLAYWFALWEQAIMRDLIPLEHQQKYFVEFLYEGLLRGDSQARAEYYNKLFGVGAFSPNDILDKENMNPFEGGDNHFVPLNMMPIGGPRPNPDGQTVREETG